ncbi:hypothetical protein, partial [Streptomyces sp. NPDC056290]
MQTLVTVVGEGGQPQDVVVTTDDDATAGDVAQALAQDAGRAGHVPGGPGNVVVLPGTAQALPYGPGTTA